ncbi:hypothetical protein HY994_02980 [Candidatus Micrarchaeota archaeon]|nr:hypothetical protein [Candidatus Micrarchaeota archaeon]
MDRKLIGPQATGASANQLQPWTGREMTGTRFSVFHTLTLVSEYLSKLAKSVPAKLQ